MIFISHTHSDKERISPLVSHLAEVYGTENVFYDSWSIRPGDSLIGKMEEGLKKCKYFFFFVSKNSLTSEMVALEWKTTLIRCAKKEDIQFIPLKLEECDLPTILRDTIYIDCTRTDIETIKRQMIDVINRQEYVQQHPLEKFNNVQAVVRPISDGCFDFEIQAKCYFEPKSSYLIGFMNEPSNIECFASGMLSVNHRKKIFMNGGNGIAIDLHKSLAVGFPTRFRLETKDGQAIQLFFLGHEKKEGCYEPIPLASLSIADERE